MNQNDNKSGWPLDELQKGDFNYDMPHDGPTLGQYAEVIRKDIVKKEEICQIKKE